MDILGQTRSSTSNTSSHLCNNFSPLAAKLNEMQQQQQQAFANRMAPPASCPVPGGGTQLCLGLPMNSHSSDVTNMRTSPFAQPTLSLSNHYSLAKQNLEQQQRLSQLQHQYHLQQQQQQQQQMAPTSALNASLLAQQQANTQLINASRLEQQQQLANASRLEQQQQQQLANTSRQRQQLVIPAGVAAATRPLTLNPIPPLFTTPRELAVLEPHLSHMSHPSPATQSRNPMPVSPAVMKDANSSAVDDARVYRRTVSSPTAWDKPLISTGHTMQPIIGSTGSVNTHPAISTAPPPMQHHTNDMRISQAGMPAASPAISTTTGPSSGGNNKPDPTALSELACHTSGTATVVKAMLAELPASLQPVVLAKVATKGRGGRQPAPDPRSADPSIDPRKARRILANRQSAARSKLKQRVLLETLRVGKEVMVAQQGDVVEELNRLRELVRDLEARNKDLEGKIQVLAGHQTTPGGLQVQPAPHLNMNMNLASASGSGGGGGGGEPSRGLQQGPATLPTLVTDVFDTQVHGWWDDHEEEDQAMDTL